MFIGHYALAMAAQRVAPRIPLAWRFFAAQLLDLLWPALVLLGAERVRVSAGDTAFTPLEFDSYPYSHSLLMTLVWAAVVTLAWRLVTGRTRDALWLGALVFSHWVLDFITHRPDLPLAPGAGPRLGLGLWNSVPGTLAVEGALFVLGVFVYARGTRARNRTGKVAFISLVVFLIVIYLGNVFGPPPPNARAVAVVSLALWLFLPWAVLIDRNREISISTGANEGEVGLQSR